MEITVKEFEQTELITIQGRIDSVEASRFSEALEAANYRGIYKLVVDMHELEYMSSAGFRALAEAQRNGQRHKVGAVVLARVPSRVREALEMVGFAEHFHIFEDVESALEFTANLPSGDSNADAAAPA